MALSWVYWGNQFIMLWHHVSNEFKFCFFENRNSFFKIHFVLIQHPTFLKQTDPTRSCNKYSNICRRPLGQDAIINWNLLKFFESRTRNKKNYSSPNLIKTPQSNHPFYFLLIACSLLQNFKVERRSATIKNLN